MLQPNFETTFSRICQKLCDKQAFILDQFIIGQNQPFETYFARFSTFVATQTQDNIMTESTDIASMNINLNYLLEKWDF